MYNIIYENLITPVNINKSTSYHQTPKEKNIKELDQNLNSIRT